MKDYTYAELHLHTAETSSCGEVAADEAIRLFKQNGYDLVCVTDHFNDRYFNYYETILPPGLDEAQKWRASVDIWLAGRHAAKDAGEKYGITVIQGAEIQLSGSRTSCMASATYTQRMTRSRCADPARTSTGVFVFS